MSVMDESHLLNIVYQNLLFETSHDRSDSSKCTIRVLHPYRFQSNLLSCVIVFTWENGITDNHHLLERDATGIAQLLQSIILVHSVFAKCLAVIRVCSNL